jgi:predicted alpha/beta-hydrolase family hydrolase
MTTADPAETVLSVDGGRLFVVPALRPLTTSGGGAGRDPLTAADGPVVVLLHGAGSGTQTPVLSRLGELLGAAGVTVARLEMPYRVAGRRAPDRAPRLDAVLTAAVALLGGPSRLGLAGASMGSRVAMRAARGVAARGVVALGFPLLPPVRGGSHGPPGRERPSRQAELSGAGVPVLVLQGERDSFGRPEADPARDIEVAVIAGADHSFKVRARDGRPAADVVAQVAGLAADWLLRHVDIRPQQA